MVQGKGLEGLSDPALQPPGKAENPLSLFPGFEPDFQRGDNAFAFPAAIDLPPK
jgi:hypothetical protein